MRSTTRTGLLRLTTTALLLRLTLTPHLTSASSSSNDVRSLDRLGVDGLRSEFNSASAFPRLLVLLSPT